MIFTVIVCIAPKYRFRVIVILLLMLIPFVAYSMYFYLGSSDKLSYYYSKSEQAKLERAPRIRSILSDLRKSEFKFRMRLEHNPHDKNAEWNLFNILGFKAYQTERYQEAIQLWDKALLVMSQCAATTNCASVYYPEDEKTKSIYRVILKLKERAIQKTQQ